jgi:hypothetical protein
MIVVPASWFAGGIGAGSPVMVEPDEPEYEFWQWLVANRELFPEVNNSNAAAVLEAFQSQTAEERKRR